MSIVLEYSILAIHLVALLILMIFGAHGFVMVYYFKKHRGPTGIRPKPLPRPPRVSVQLPIFNEYYVVERLIRAACRMDYPRDCLEIQVLDDSTDETAAISRRLVEEYRGQGFNIHWRHRQHRHGFKAGALNEGLAAASGEFIAIFDADFVPPRDFLLRTLPHFANVKTGMVQTRWGHLNANFSLLTRAQAIGLDGHFVVEQAARNGAGFFINFNGTAGIWRRTCILDAGGWSADTLTEDLDLSYRAQMRGWKFKFLQDTVCPAELPAEIGGVKSQQFRWTKGAIETAKKILPQVWRSTMPLRTKLQSTIHLTNNLVFPFILVVSLLNVPLVLLKNLPLILPTNAGAHDYSLYFDASSIFLLAFFGSFWMYLTSQKELYSDWRRRMLYFPILMAGSMGLAVNNTRAIMQGLFNRKSEFQRTPKYHIESNGDYFYGKKYFNMHDQRTRFSDTGILELVLAFYSFVGIVISLRYVELGAVPFQSLFCCGYAYIGFLSFKYNVLSRFKTGLANEFCVSRRIEGVLQSH